MTIDTTSDAAFGEVVHVVHGPSPASVLVVCEHASNRIPDAFDGLGLDAEARVSHAAWDPGALGVARALAETFGATLVHGGVSRLIYDCNRPPTAPSAVPEQSEKYAIPGNTGLTPDQRRARVDHVYLPFARALSGVIAAQRETLTLMVTVHSFAPVFNDRPRAVELGLLHGRDDRFATAMLARTPRDTTYDTRLNEPYAATDGVAHTLDVQGVDNDLLNVMIELRNDLIQTPDQQTAMAAHLAPWIAATLADLTSGQAA